MEEPSVLPKMFSLYTSFRGCLWRSDYSGAERAAIAVPARQHIWLLHSDFTAFAIEGYTACAAVFSLSFSFISLSLLLDVISSHFHAPSPAGLPIPHNPAFFPPLLFPSVRK